MPAIDYHSKVLQLISIKGPVIPSNINRELDTNILFSSAILSEMVDNKILKLSNLKFGGSPLYFKPGQEHLLQNFADKLNEKDRRTFDLLKKERVLRDSHQTPLVRVSLRSIKDFAIPLDISNNGQKELFWKWYLLSNLDVEPLIKSILGISDSDEQTKEVKDIKEDVELKQENIVKQEKDIKKEKDIGPEEEIKREVQTVTSFSQQASSQTTQQLIRQDSIQENSSESQHLSPDLTGFAERIISEKKNLDEERNKLANQREFLKVERDRIEELKQELLGIKRENELIKKQFMSSSASSKHKREKEVQTKINPAQEPAEKKKEFPLDDFSSRIKSFLVSSKINLVDFSVVRKGSELDMVVDIPTPVGSVAFYCKAKSKKTINDGDLSTAFVQGQLKKLPVIFLTEGKLTKKAESMLSNEFQGVIFKNL